MGPVLTPRSLILVHSEGWQDIRDFQRIKAHVEDIAPDVAVSIASNLLRNSHLRKAAARNPTLIFSPIRLQKFRPVRGRLYVGQPCSKLDEMKALIARGMRVPKFEEITPDTALSEQDYGPYVIVKPSHALASWGIGVELLRTKDVRYRPPSAFPADHPGRLAPMIAQKFIDCGRAMNCRVLTLFGTPIFTYCRESTDALALEGKEAPFRKRDFMPTPHNSVGYVTHDPDILAFAGSAFQAVPQVALQACDILRSKDGELYLLEINPGGGTWMFSNISAQAYKQRLGVDDLQDEFDAFRTCAKLLVDRTRVEAV